LVLNKFRDSNGEPELHLFGQLKRIAREWLDRYLICKGGTYPAQLKYKTLADIACEKINAGINRALIGSRPIKAVLDAYNPVGSTAHVRFNTSKPQRWETDSRRCHINWVVLDSDWEAEFCRVVESHPRVRAYVKNHNLGLEVPYRYLGEIRRYRPDFIVLIDDGYGENDLLRLIVEIKGYRGEDAKEKKSTMDTYWVPGVNNLEIYGRWAFAEFTSVYQIQADFETKVDSEFKKIIDSLSVVQPNGFAFLRNRAAEQVRTHYGTDAKLLDLNSFIWDTIASSQDHSFKLSALSGRQAGQTETEQTLAVLALLCSPSIQLLRFQLRSESGQGNVVESSELARQLSNWWRAKKLTDEDWERWATSIMVSWGPKPS
jgi:hypothetical protein